MTARVPWFQQNQETLDRIAADAPALLDDLSPVSDDLAALGAERAALEAAIDATGGDLGAGSASAGVLRLAAAVKDGETVTIGADVYEIDTDGVVTGGRLAVDVSAGAAVAAQGTLTVTLQPTAGDTMTVGAVMYTFVALGQDDLAGEITVGANVAAARLAIVAAINGTDGHNTAHPTVTAAAFVAAASVITAKTPGTAGNSIVTTETFTDVASGFDAATLGTTRAGVDSTGAQAATALVTAINTLGTEDVLAAANISGGDPVLLVFSADAPGGDVVPSTAALATTETLAGANNAWGGATMVAGAAAGAVTIQHFITHTATAGEAAGQQCVIALPFVPLHFIVQKRSSVGVIGGTLTVTLVGSLLTVADAGLTAGDVVTVIAGGVL